jgi:hypothetical protein
VQIGATHRVYEEKKQCCYVTTMGAWKIDDHRDYPGVYPMLEAGLSFDNYNDADRQKYAYASSRYVSSSGSVHLEAGDAPAVKFPPSMGYPGNINDVKKNQRRRSF